MKIFFLSLFIFVYSISTINAQKAELKRFTVEAGKYLRINAPVSVDISDIDISDSLSYQLFELIRGKEIETPSQVEPGYYTRLWWILEGSTPAGTKREYVLYKNQNIIFRAGIKTEEVDGLLRLKKDDKPVLDYYIKLHYPPKGVDTMYRRNGFIHPMYSPSGNILTRIDADGTRARWTDVGGMFKGNGESGIVFMSHPSNREYPEPMRVWPIDQNGRGDVYFEFCPIRLKDWVLNPGNVYRLKYRMLVYDGKVDKTVSERIWTDFAYPPIVKSSK